MIDANESALQDGEDTFDAVGRHIFANIFASAVVDRIVVESRMVNPGVCATFVRVQCRANFDMPLNGILDRRPIYALDGHRNRTPRRAHASQ
jgi:hypothetical protein